MNKEFFNEMPRPTFRWLRVNHYESRLKDINKDGSSTITIEGDKEIINSLDNKSLINNEYMGVNKNSLDLVKDNYREAYKVHVNKGESKKVSIKIDLNEKSPYEALRLMVEVEEDGQLDLILSIDSEKDFPGQCHLLTEIIGRKNSNIKFKKALICNETIQHIEHRYTDIDESANVEFLSVEVGGEENLYNFENRIRGLKSNLSHKFAYLGDREQRFDISMLMLHEGKKSNSDIHCLGALTGDAVKAFRGTLDFLTGCTGSEGSEEDTCLLLNDKVKSISVPLLLCKEDDVVGNHAASAGQMDPNKLFYLMSRGFTEDEAKHMLVESMLRPVIDELEDEYLENKALDLIRHKI